MAVINMDSKSTAIPTLDVVFDYLKLIKPHPDILFEMPPHLGLFSKKFIEIMRNRYSGTGLCPYKPNCISLGIRGSDTPTEMFVDSMLCLDTQLYFDFDEVKCFVAFNCFNISNDTILYIADNIKTITNKNVYLNIKLRKYPNFEKLVTRYINSDLFQDYSAMEKISYQQRKYEDNIYELYRLFLNYTSSINNIMDIIDV
ncbi:hypothetical protein QJ856_gp0604 [Tupanvirus deep ocean]|uniref:Uncharacterized protein n=2 Tax=Tupanvirus TaxID=2094720 RepID=A0AC62A8R5_9VIRU|nr:hypothetical protein QJ856_gp0604 [Tupanvirus deep ocean]QKU34142.1 hypothetical protein [Tupanvirus deep ocean]